VHAIVGIVAIATIAFFGTMIDNLLAFAAQLSVAPPAQVRRLALAQSASVAALLGMSLLLGTALRDLPRAWIAIFAAVPWFIAWRSVRAGETSAPTTTSTAGAAFFISLSLGADNVAVWSPLMRSGTVRATVLFLATCACWNVIAAVATISVARHPRIREVSARYGQRCTPFLYLGIGVLIIGVSGVVHV